MEIEMDPLMHAFKQRVSPEYREQVRRKQLEVHAAGTRSHPLWSAMGGAAAEPKPTVETADSPVAEARDLEAAIAFAQAAQEPPDDGLPLYYDNGVPIWGDEDDYYLEEEL